jgi:hypothetical protein
MLATVVSPCSNLTFGGPPFFEFPKGWNIKNGGESRLS